MKEIYIISYLLATLPGITTEIVLSDDIEKVKKYAASNSKYFSVEKIKEIL